MHYTFAALTTDVPKELYCHQSTTGPLDHTIPPSTQSTQHSQDSWIHVKPTYHEINHLPPSPDRPPHGLGWTTCSNCGRSTSHGKFEGSKTKLRESIFRALGSDLIRWGNFYFFAPWIWFLSSLLEKTTWENSDSDRSIGCKILDNMMYYNPLMSLPSQALTAGIWKMVQSHLTTHSSLENLIRSATKGLHWKGWITAPSLTPPRVEAWTRVANSLKDFK